uniref:Uncharacterized protein n=1 Tax=Phakopsora pachyrhizi TaxID=170000 RepID=A0A0S1MK16_PHAPC
MAMDPPPLLLLTPMDPWLLSPLEPLARLTVPTPLHPPIAHQISLQQ